MTFHHLRHTHATILLSRGEYVNEVSARLGHANPKTTYSIYGHVLPKNQRRLSTNFDQYVPE
jgi:integrase